MKQRPLRRRAAVALVAAMSVVMTAAPSALASTTMQFTGGARARTPDVAIQSAIGDAEVSAQSMGFFSCTLVGEPAVFEGTDPIRGRIFRAQATIECTS